MGLWPLAQIGLLHGNRKHLFCEQVDYLLRKQLSMDSRSPPPKENALDLLSDFCQPDRCVDAIVERMTSRHHYQIAPIDSAEATRLQQAGREVYVADAMPGSPCRRCLKDAEIDDELILVSHDPFNSDSPYRSASPIFLHRHACQPPDLDELPLQLTGRQLSVRSFDTNEMMIDADVIDGEQLDETIRRFFNDQRSTKLHVHNASRGCWATSIMKAE